MNSKNLVICDTEEAYARAFAEYLARKKELAFQVYICSSLAQVLELQEEVAIHYFLVAAGFPAEYRKQVVAETHLVFTTTGDEDLHSHESPIFKYQPAEKILEELYKAGREELAGGLFFQNVNAKASRIIGVYSPVGRIESARYVQKLSRELADRGQTLVLTTQAYVGLPGVPDTAAGENLSDLIYFLKQEKQNLSLYLASIVYHQERLDYVLPAEVSEDIKSTSAGEWVRLLHQIMEKSSYDVVVFDISDGLPQLSSIFSLCDEVHIPYPDDVLCGAVVESFEQEMLRVGGTGLQNKFIRKERKSDSSRTAPPGNY